MPTDIPDTPQTRTEQYLAAANGQDVELPTPLTREEAYLHEIATKMQGGTPVLETLVVESNGTYTPDEGVDGFNRVEVDVTPTLISLNAYENGSYYPSTGEDGFDSAFVAVPTWRLLDYRSDPKAYVDMPADPTRLFTVTITANTSDGTIHSEAISHMIAGLRTEDTVTYSQIDDETLRIEAKSNHAIVGVLEIFFGD